MPAPLKIKSVFLLLALLVGNLSIQSAMPVSRCTPAPNKKVFPFKKKVNQWLIKRMIRNRNPDDAKTAKLLSVLALVSMITMVFGIFSIALAIIAIVKGKKILRKDPGNKDAPSAVKMVWITLGILLAFLLLGGALITIGLLI